MILPDPITTLRGSLMFVLLIPFIGSILVRMLDDTPRRRDVVSLLLSILLFINMLNLFTMFVKGGKPVIVLTTILPGLDIAFHLEMLGMVFIFLVSFLWIVTTLYGVGYMRSVYPKGQEGFFPWVTLAIAATIAIALSANLFTMFLCYELLTLSTYPLVNYKKNEEGGKAGRHYLMVLLGTSLIFFFPAIIYCWYETGTTYFHVRGIMASQASAEVTYILFLFFVFGISKTAIMPFHTWLPRAMVAPTPVSALLHAVAVVKSGIFALLKCIIYIFGVDHLRHAADSLGIFGHTVTLVAGATILLASLMALQQDNLKRMLAFSTISQLSYCVLAASLLTPQSLVAAAIHMVAHAFAKITLFFSAGAIYIQTGNKNISEIAGIGKQMPWTMGAFTVAALSIVGLPFTAGFISKFYIISSAWDINQWEVIVVLVTGTLLSASYFVPVIYTAYWGGKQRDRDHAPFPVRVALVMTALCTIIAFMISNHIHQLLGEVFP